MGWDQVGRSVERDAERALIVAGAAFAAAAGFVGGLVALGVDVVLRRHRA